MITLWETHENTSPETQRLGLCDDEFRPVQVHPRLEQTVNHPDGCTSDETSSRSDRFVNFTTKHEGILIRELAFRFEIDINKKFKTFSLLFNDVKFLPVCEVCEVGPPKGVQVFVGDVKLTTVHEDMGRSLRRLGAPLFDAHYSKRGSSLY